MSDGLVVVAEVRVEYHGGLPELVVELPSRRERCSFRLRPVSHVVGDLVHMLKQEDRGIDRVTVRTMGRPAALHCLSHVFV